MMVILCLHSRFFNLLGETIEDGPEFDAAFNAIDVDGNGL